MKRKVVIITDCTDVAFLEIRGAIYSNTINDEYEIEPIVEVKEYSIENASFLVRLIAEIYPKGTVINVVVHPSKIRGERVVGRTANKEIVFEGTNTGAFGWLIEDLGCNELYELHDPGFVPFGGKYVHAPAVGKILSGIPLNMLGREFNKSLIRDVKRDKGTILHIDNFGNVKFVGDIEGEDGDRFIVRINDKEYPAVFCTRMMEREDGELVVYPGSSMGFPEIGIVRDNAANAMNIHWSDKVLCYRIGD